MMVLLLQTSFIAVTAWLLGRMLLARRPELTASLAVAAILVTTCLAILAPIPFQRPWQVHAHRIVRGANVVDPQLGPRGAQHEGDGVAQARRGLQLSMLIGLSWRSLRGTVAEARNQGAKLLIGSVFVLTVVLCGRRLVAGWSIIQMHRRSRICGTTQDAWFSRVEGLIALHVTRAIVIRESSEIRSPCVTWLYPRVIYVPPSFATWTQEEQDAAMVHEVSHILRYDPPARFLASLWKALFWFHPVVHIIYSQLQLAQELAADRLAVRLIADRRAYVRGVSSLALRLDTMPGRTTDDYISVASNDLIRRIMMLRNMDVGSERVGRCGGRIATSLLVLAGLVVACVAEEKDDVRLAKRRASAAAKVAGTAVPPWETLGDGQGYVRIRLSQFVSHPVAMPFVQPVLSKVFGAASPEDAALSLANVSRLQARIQCQVSDAPEAQRASGHRHQLRLNSDAFELLATDPVSWPQVAEEIQWDAFGATDEGIQKVRELISSHGRSKRLYIVSEGETAGSSLPMPPVDSVWKQIDGGTLSLVMRMDHRLPEKELVAKGLGWLSDAQVIGLGLHLGNAGHDGLLRFAFSVHDQETAVVAAQSITDSLDALSDSVGGEVSKNGLPPALLRAMSQWKVDVLDSSRDASIVVVSGSLPDAAMAALLESF